MRKIILTAAAALLSALMATTASANPTVGNKVCLILVPGNIVNATCPKNLPVKMFICRPNGEATFVALIPVPAGIPRPSAPFTLKVDPSNARLTIDNTVIRTTDVYRTTEVGMAEPPDWSGVTVRNDQNSSPMMLEKISDGSLPDGSWLFTDYGKFYTCVPTE